MPWNVPTHMAPAGTLQQLLDASAHLGGGLVGEGDREHVVRGRALGGDDVRDAMDEHARLAAAGAGEHQGAARAAR